jgi:transposase
MFFRLKKTGSGQVLKLIESYRDLEGVPRHRTVVSLGNAQIDPLQYKPIAQAVQMRLYAQESLQLGLELNEGCQEWADRIVRKVEQEGCWTRYARETGGSLRASLVENSVVIDGVIADQVSHSQSALLGPVLAGWHAWNTLGLTEYLRTLGFSESQCQAAAISVINRLTDPVAEYNLPEWFSNTALPELMGCTLKGAGDDRFYRISDKLLDHQVAIEAHVSRRQKTLFNLDRTVLLYDLTNTHFEGACEANPMARYGKNKQKRTDCPQVVVGIVFDAQGFAVAHRLFDGNQSDGTSLPYMLETLEATIEKPSKKPMIIMDAGLASVENRKLLQGKGYNYLINDSRGIRKKYKEHFEDKDLFRPVDGRTREKEVLVCTMNDPKPNDLINWTEQIVLCQSEARSQKEHAMLSKAELRMMVQLEKLAARITGGTLKDSTKIDQAIGRIRAKNSRVSRFYTIERSEETPSRLIWARKDASMEEADALCGCYVLRTNQAGLDACAIWKLYITLTRAEAGFRALKSDLGLRPNHHQIESRVEGHIFICTLAYQLMCQLLYPLETAGDARSWETLRRILATHTYTTVHLPTQDGTLHRIRNAGHPDERQAAIYRTLGIEWRKLPRAHTIIQKTEAATGSIL